MLKRVKEKIRSVIRQETKAALQESMIIDRVHTEWMQELQACMNAKMGDAKEFSASQTDEKNAKRIETINTAIKNNSHEDVLRSIKQIATEKKQVDRMYMDSAKEIRKMILAKKDRTAWNTELKALFEMHTIDEFTSDQFADVYHNRFPIMQAASLRQQFVRRRRMKQIGNVPDKWLTYNKQAGEEFAKMVGVKYPQSTHGLRLEDIPHEKDIVIKPLSANGAKGVYIVRSDNDILSVEHKNILHSWDEMQAEIRNDLDKGRIASNCFEIQEAVHADYVVKGPAHDLKFYAFYGDIPAVLEIARAPEKAYWWWTGDGQLIDIGKTMPDHLKPVGFTPEMLETARKLSLKIPAPYMRLDFLCGEKAFLFDEFCSMSGGAGAGVLEQLFPSWDRLFGNCYLKAEMRIVNDLLAGKRFDEINEFNRICDEKYGKKK